MNDLEGGARRFRIRAGLPMVAGLWRFCRIAPVAGVSAAILVAIALAAIFAPRLAPYDPLAANYAVNRFAPSATHPLGTDDLGRDILSRIIYGGRVTLAVALASVLLGDSVGFLWGIISAYVGGRLDLIGQRVLDVLMAFPSLILALLLMVSLGAGIPAVVIAIAVTRIPMSTRVIRSLVLSVKELQYVEAARGLGGSGARIMASHVAPQCVALFLVIASAHLGVAIFTESALSFMGVGVPPPAPSWGNMLGGVLSQAFRPPWWMALFPGLAITVTILAANLFGDGLRDYFDPRLTTQSVQ
jgi:peptide/nickel transport system permease protein